MRVDHGGHRVGGIVKSVDEFKSQSDQQRDAKQYKGIDSRIPDDRQVARQMVAGIDDAYDHYQRGQRVEPGIRPLSNERRNRGRGIDRFDTGHGANPKTREELACDL
jgi:hypothetical protein